MGYSNDRDDLSDAVYDAMLRRDIERGFETGELPLAPPGHRPRSTPAQILATTLFFGFIGLFLLVFLWKYVTA